jgi:hypothetical protein
LFLEVLYSSFPDEGQSGYDVIGLTKLGGVVPSQLFFLSPEKNFWVEKEVSCEAVIDLVKWHQKFLFVKFVAPRFKI